jgi:phenylacetic acid degradation protein
MRRLSEQEMAWKVEGTLTYQELTQRSLATLVETEALSAVEPDRKRFDLPGVQPLIELRKQAPGSDRQ